MQTYSVNIIGFFYKISNENPGTFFCRLKENIFTDDLPKRMTRLFIHENVADKAVQRHGNRLKKIKGTKLITKADIKANPGTRRRILLRIERAKKERKRGGRPILIGKAYASDKRGKGMQVPLVSKLDRRKIQSDISESVRAFMKKKTGYKKGGDIKKLKTVAAKLQKASKAHKGQSRTLRRIISKYV